MTGLTLPDAMQACRLVEYDAPYKLDTIPIPSDLDEHSILVRIGAASYCHTDSMVSSGIFKTSLPCTPSHEGAGTVVSIGSSVTDFSIEDRVLCGIAFYRCRECAECKGPEEQTQYCRNTKGGLGISRDGCFAQYAVADAREAAKLPDGLSFTDAAPLACAGVTVWRAIVKADLQEGQWLGIVGSGGGLGHLAVQFAKAKGLKVIGLDAREEGIDLSKECGADHVLDVRQEKSTLSAKIHKITGYGGTDATLNLSDHSTAASLAAAMTRMHGTMIQVAQPPEVSVPFAELVFRDIRIHGSLTSSRGEAQRMLEFVKKHGIETKTRVFDGLDKLPDLLDLVHSGKLVGKAVIAVEKDDQVLDRL